MSWGPSGTAIRATVAGAEVAAASGGASVQAQARVQAQPFNTVVEWLDRLQKTHSIEVQRISLDAEGQPGLVNAQIRLI